MNNTFSILSWNINGRLRLHLNCPIFCNHFLTGSGIVAFHETHLRPNEADLLPTLPTHDLYHTRRPAPLSFAKPGGGIAVYVNKSVTNSRMLPAHTSPDCITLHCETFIFVCAYLPPASSPWMRLSVNENADPIDFFMQVLTTLNESYDLPIIACGDWNMRMCALCHPDAIDTTINA
jgi:exonuclease III